MSQLLRHSASIFGSLIAIGSAYGQPIAAPEPVFSKVFGGSSGWDFADSIAVDSQGNVVVAGTTNSPDFPLTNAIQPRITQPPLIVNTGNGLSAYPQLGPAVDVTALAESADGAVVYAASSSGIFRSLDGGVTWSQQLPGLTGANTLAVDTGSADILYAGVPQVQGISAAGFFKSVDGGQHWTPVNLAGVSNSGIYSVATTALAPGTVYAQIKALYRSRDGGTTWTALAPNGYFIYAFGLAPSDPNIVYAVASDGLVYRSADGGDTWSASGAKFGNAYPNPMASAVAVDPLDRNTVWIVAGDNLVKSTDAGATFQVVFNSTGLVWLSLSRTQGRILVSSRETAWASLDNGATWKAIAQPFYLNTAFAGRSSFFAGTNASTDGFVTKWSADGTQILFSTFLSRAQNLLAAEDAAGNTYVTGVTASPLFPVTSGMPPSPNGSGNLFLTKFDPSGNLQFSELLGVGQASAIAIGASGDVFLTSGAPGCPDTGNPAPLALRLDARGNLIYSKVFTETCSGLTTVSGIAVDASGDLYLAGSTFATDLPTTATAIEPLYPGANSTAGFLARLTPQGDAVTYLSYLGGPFSSAGGIAIDSIGDIYVSGGSNDFPSTIQTTSDLTIPATCGSPFEHAFVMKLSPSSNTPLWLTKWGAGCDDVSGSIALDGQGNIWAGGVTRSSFFPMVSPLLVRGVSDGFVTELSPDGTKIMFSSFVVGNFALGPKDSLYIGGSVIPYPRKLDSLQMTGVAEPTSVLVERVDTSATRTDVIESITNLNPVAYDQDPLFFWIGPGEMIRIGGHGLGPAVEAGAQLDSNGLVSTSVAGTRILFDGVPAPLISVQESAVVCISPFAIGGRASTSVQIERNGAAAPGVGVAVRPVAAQPDVLAIANQGGVPNSQSNPAHVGQTVTLYVTGFGDTIPPVPDGSIYQAPLPAPAVPLFGSYPYAGPAPGEVAGVWQINVPVPAGATGNPVQIQVLSQPMSGGIYPRVNASIWVAP